MPPGSTIADPPPNQPGGSGEFDTSGTQARAPVSASRQQNPRFRHLATLAIAIFVGASFAYLGQERQQYLEKGRQQVTRSAQRLSLELAQTLSVARVSIDQAEYRLSLLPVGWMRNMASGNAAENAALVAVLGLPFELHAVTSDGRSVALIEPSPSPEAGVLRPPPANTAAGRWHLVPSEGATESTTVSLFWPAAPNQHGVSGYRVDLPTVVLNNRFALDRFSPGSRIAFWHADEQGRATFLAGSGQSGAGTSEMPPALVQAWMRTGQGLIDVDDGEATGPRMVAYSQLPGDAAALIVTHGVAREVLLAPWSAKLPWVLGLVLLLSAGMGYGGWRLDRSLQALARSELRFRLAAASGKVWEWDIAKREVHYPVTFWEKLGLPAPSPAQAQRHLESLLQPHDLAAIRSATRHHIQSREPCVMEFQIKDASGRSHWFETRGQAVWDKRGRATYMAGTMFEITERHELQEAQRQALQKLSSVTHASAAMFWTMDASRHIDWFNQRWLDFTGRTLAQECGRGWIEGVHPDDLDECLTRADKAMVLHQPYAVEYRLRRHDGQYRWILDQGQPLFDTDGTLTGYVGSCIDITEPKQAEAERERLNRFVVLLFGLASRFINLQTPQLNIEINKALGEMGEFVNADRAYLFTLDFQTQTGSNTHEWCAPGMASQIAHLQDLPMSLIPEWVETHQHGDIMHIADVALLPPGSLRDTLEPQGIQSLLTLPLTGSDGSCLGFVGFDSVRARHTYDADELGLLQLFAQMMVNVHERQATEAQVQRLQDELEQRVLERTQQLDASVHQLQQVNHELEAFTYSVSHDLKAPLRGIDGYCLLLREDHADALNPEAMEFLLKIHRATQHMATLINDLLAYSRLERHTQQLVDLDMGPLVREVVEELGNEIQLSSLHLDTDVPDGLRVRADRLGLSMALRNLLDNAIKFSRHSPSPTIRISVQRDADEVILSVQDNGLGFDMKYHSRIFTIFQRLETSDLYPGTGIGLAMVHRAIDRMGGRIWAESAPGAGATFFIALQEAQQPPTTALPAAD